MELEITEGFVPYVKNINKNIWVPTAGGRGGVYLIHFLALNKWYIGWGMDIKANISPHISAIKHGNSSNAKIRAACKDDQSIKMYVKFFVNRADAISHATEIVQKYQGTFDIINAAAHLPKEDGTVLSETNGRVTTTRAYVVDNVVYRTKTAVAVAHGTMSTNVDKRVGDPKFPTWEFFDEEKHAHLSIKVGSPHRKRKVETM